MAPQRIIPGHGSRGTPANGSRPARHDDDWLPGLPAGAPPHAYGWIAAFSGRSVRGRVAGAHLEVYPGAPRRITDTHPDQLDNDLLEVLTS